MDNDTFEFVETYTVRATKKQNIESHNGNEDVGLVGSIANENHDLNATV